MGGSSSQTIGYRYSAGVMAVIGNRIEKVLDINPDERGWIMTKQEKEMLDAGETNFIIEKREIFGGDNQEGGWRGSLFVHVGKDDQLQNPYLINQLGDDVSAYPNLSYLVFGGASMNFETGFLVQDLNKGFELVSMSGMMKDFMLWVKRIHVKNNGDTQWYDAKSEIGGYRYSGGSGSIFKPLSISMSGTVSWDTADGSESQSWGSGKFPFYDRQKSYQAGDMVELPVDPSIIAAQPVLISNNVEFDSSFGTEIPPCTWSGMPPETDYFDNGAKARRFTFDGEFYWGGGNFDYRGVISQNNANIQIGIGDYGSNEYISVISVSSPLGSGFSYFEASTYLNKGIYTIHVDTGNRYLNQNTPRPFAQLLVKYKLEESGHDAPDINPIHKAREIITDDTAMNKPESLINDANFMAMADRIWDEGLGISWCIQEKSCKEALEELEYHIEGGFRINRQTGLYECILFRDDLLDLDNALSFNESNIKSIEFDLVNSDDQPSSVNVNYYDRPLIKNSNFYLYENGLARTRGFDVTQNLEFPYFMNRRNAELVGNWKLKQLSTATWKGSFKTGILDARKLNKYDVIKLSWISKNLSDLPVRVMKINLGDGINNTVTIDFVEVIPYSSIDYSSTVVDPHEDDNLPPQSNINTAFEMPYFESVQRFGQTQVDAELSATNEIGYLMMSAAKPQSNSLNAQLYSDGATGSIDNIQKVSVIDYCPALSLKNPIGYTDTLFDVEDIPFVDRVKPILFSGATQGTWIILNNEIMVFESYDFENNRISVKRGALDTVPQKHDQGVIFFSDEFSGVDQTQYILGETVRSQSLTTTPSAIQNKGNAQIKETEFNARAIRPYPPANVKLNDVYYPESIEGNLNISWNHRNRVQQTGGNIIGWFDNGVSTESGVSYAIKIKNNLDQIVFDSNVGDVESYSVDLSEASGDRLFIEISSKRDNFDSYMKYMHDFSFVGETFLYKNLFKNLDGIEVVGNSYTLTPDSVNGGLTFSSSDSNDKYVKLTDTPLLNAFSLELDVTQISSGTFANFAIIIGTNTWDGMGYGFQIRNNQVRVLQDGSEVTFENMPVSNNVKYHYKIVSTGTNVSLYRDDVFIISRVMTIPSSIKGFRFYPWGGEQKILIENYVISDV